ncbi:hypothetical protein D3C86_1673450 [compost metagenome]
MKRVRSAEFSQPSFGSESTTGFGRITIIATQAAPKTMAKVTPNSRIVVVGMVVRESSRLGNWGA